MLCLRNRNIVTVGRLIAGVLVGRRLATGWGKNYTGSESMETGILRNMARETAELALQLAALPSEGLRNGAQALEEIEQLAKRILKEASTARTGTIRDVGETRGMWRAIQLVRP